MKQFFLIVLLFLPMLAEAKPYTFPSGRTFEETISFHRTLSGALVTVSEWKEILGVLKKANAKEETLKDTVKNYIRNMSEFYGVDAEFMIRLGSCESIDYNEDVVNNKKLGDKGKAMGIFQWWEKSWHYYNKIYKTNLDRKSWIDQTKMSVWVVRDYGTDDWFNCYQYIKTGSWDFLKKKAGSF